MGCGGSEEDGEENGGVVVEEHGLDEHPERVQVHLFVEREADKELTKLICWCDPDMLLVGLLDEAIALAGWEGKAWEDVELTIPELSSPVNMVSVNAALSTFAPKFKATSLKEGVWGFPVYAYLKGDAEAAEHAVKFATELSTATASSSGEKELARRAGQLEVRVFAAVPADAADPGFSGDGVPAETNFEEGKATVFEVKLWATGKVLVGAIIDAANSSLVKLTDGVTFGKAETVTSYVLGEGGDKEHPLLDFEISDEIEDLDGFETLHAASPPKPLQFIVYNKIEEGKAACQVSNFWGAESMLIKYREQGADVGALVKPEHCVQHEVQDWPALIQAVQN